MSTRESRTQRSARRAGLALGVVLFGAGCADLPDVVPASVAGDPMEDRSLIWGAADNEAWIVGAQTHNGAGAIARWDGQRATIVNHPAFRAPTHLAGSSSSNVWLLAGGGDSDLQILRWNGAAWTIVRTISAPAPTPVSLVVLSERDVWIAGNGLAPEPVMGVPVSTPWIAHWDGTRFDQEVTLSRDMTGQRPSSFVARADGTLWMRTGSARVTQVHAPGTALTEWRAVDDPPNHPAPRLVMADDSTVLLQSLSTVAWSNSTARFDREVAPSTGRVLVMKGGVATNERALWFSSARPFGTGRCSLSGSVLGGISGCSPAGYYATILHWNGARWSSTALPQEFLQSAVQWREPTSGALWVSNGTLMARVRADQLRQ